MTSRNAYSLFDPQTACLTEKAMYDYIDSKLTEAESHAVEKHLLDCAFCSEAMEGLELVKDRNKLREAAAAIEERLDKPKAFEAKSDNLHTPETDRGKLLSFNFYTRMAAAAVVVLLLGSYLLLHYMSDKTADNGVAQKKELNSPPPLVSTPDDEAFQKHFEPFPPKERELQKEKERDEETNGTSVLQESDGPGSISASGNSNSVSEDIVRAEPSASAPARPDQLKSKSDQAPESPAVQNPANLKETVAVKNIYKKKTEPASPAGGAGYFKGMDSVRASGEEQTLTISTAMREEKSKSKAAKKHETEKAEKNTNFSSSAASTNLPPQVAFNNKDEDKSTSSNMEAGRKSVAKPKAQDDKKETSTINKVVVTDSTYMNQNLPIDVAGKSAETKPEQIALTPTTKTTNASSNATGNNTGSINSSDAYNWAPQDERKSPEKSSPTVYTTRLTGKQNKNSMHTARSKVAAGHFATAMDEAMAAYGNKDFPNAIDKFRKVLVDEPSNETALFYTGVSYLSLPRPDALNALINLEDVLKNPKSSFAEAANWYKALALIKDKREAEAQTLLHEIILGNGAYKTKAEALLKDLNQIKK
jgi:hypothetical protein